MAVAPKIPSINGKIPPVAKPATIEAAEAAPATPVAAAPTSVRAVPFSPIKRVRSNRYSRTLSKPPNLSSGDSKSP